MPEREALGETPKRHRVGRRYVRRPVLRGPPLHDPRYREAVYALPDQGQHDAGEPGVSGYPLVELACRPRRRVLRVEHGTTPYGVIAED